MRYRNKEWTFTGLHLKHCHDSIDYVTFAARLRRLKACVPSDEEIEHCFRPSEAKNGGRKATRVTHKGKEYRVKDYLTLMGSKLTVNCFRHRLKICKSNEEALKGKPMRKTMKAKAFTELRTTNLWAPTSASFDASYKKSWRLR